MGRSKSVGLDFFPLDSDFYHDIKIRKLIKYQGGKAVSVYVCLLCIIYSERYYIRWDKDLPFIIAEQTGFEEDFVQMVITNCLTLGLLSKGLYESDGILTSVGIQTRYQRIMNMAKRKGKIVEYSLLSSNDSNENPDDDLDEISDEEKPITSEEKPITSEEKPITSEESTQNKKKINRNIGDSNESLVCGTSQPHAERINYDQLVDFFNSETKGVFGIIRSPLSETRRGMISARVKTYGKDAFADMIRRAYRSDFLKGQNKNGWRASFDWLIKPTNFEKVISGNYDNKDVGCSNAASCTNEELARSTASGIARALYNKQQREQRD